MNIFWFLVAFAGLAGLVWFVFFLISRGSWGEFAKAFPGGDVPSGKRFTVTAVFCGGPVYNRCVYVTISLDGLHVEVPLPNHAPFFVPWGAVRNCSLEKHLFFSSIDVEIPSSSDVLILQFPQRAMLDLQDHLHPIRSEPPPLPRNG